MKNLTVKSIIELSTIEQMIKHFDIVKQLYPEMSEEDYKRKLKEMLKNGYRQVAVLDDELCIGIAGFWINTRLYCDKYIDIDNVIVKDEYRAKGVGKIVMEWLEQTGKKSDCKYAVLDAYVENSQAHKFYFKEGYIVRGFHFTKQL